METTQQTETLPYQNAPRRCFLNAFVNSRHIYKGLNLKMKIGTMKYKQYYMYQEPRTIEYVEREWNKYEAFAAHCWLEDDEGNVYDFWLDDMIGAGDMRIEKMTKKEIKKFHYEYIEFPKTIQTKMFVLMYKKLKMWEELLQMDVDVV
jgi:hypothetical protein